MSSFLHVLLLLFAKYSLCLQLSGIFRGFLPHLGLFSISLILTLYEAFNCIGLNKLSNCEIDLRSIFFCLCISILIRVSIESLPLCGRLIDVIRGTQYSEQFAPELGLRESYLEVFSVLLTVIVFFAWDLHYVLIKGLLMTSDTSVPGQSGVLHLITITIETAIWICAPLMIVSLFIELVCTVYQKLVPKFHFGVEQTCIRSCIGILFFVFLCRYSESGLTLVELQILNLKDQILMSLN